MNNNHGYSLVELVITIVLVGIAFPGLIAFITNDMEDTLKSEIINKAIILAEEKMEGITADKHEPTRGLAYIQTSGQYPGENIEQYTRTVAIQQIIIGSVNCVEVLVTVTHPLMNNNYTLAQLFTEYYAN